MIDAGVLKPIKDNQLEINADSQVFNEIFLEYVESSQNQKIPQNIKEAFKLIDKFEKQKKVEFGYTNIVNAYSAVIPNSE